MQLTVIVAFLLSIPLALCDPAAKDGQTFECSEAAVAIDGKWGYLSIKKDKKSCGFKGSASFILIETKDLTLTNMDNIKIVSDDTSSPEKIFYGPFEAEYLAIGLFAELAFSFNATDNNPATLLKFTTDPVIKIQGDRLRQLSIQSFQVDRYNFEIKKTISQPLHAEVYGGSDPFGHYFIKSNETSKNILVEHPQPLLKILTTPITGNCSNSFSDASEVAHDLAGPQDISKAGQSFKCVNIFNLKLNSPQAHYDVSFANFMDISDTNDRLTISDGTSTLEITKFSAKTYYQQKPVVSFRGPNLVVIYNDPQIRQKTFVSKLIVNARENGGVFDSYGTLPLPAKGVARYTLGSTSDSQSSLTIKGEFKGSDLTILDGKSSFTLKEGMSIPPEIVVRDYNIEVDVKSKPSWSLDYKQAACGGIIFTTGAISLEGGNKTCYWLLGAKSSLTVLTNNLSDQKSCLEIYQLTQKTAVFSKCGISPTEVLPPFIVGPAYVKVTSNSNTTDFKANVLEPMTGLIASASSLNSIGYPVTYPWYDTSDAQQYNATGKSIVLSVKDLDLREGEKLVIDSQVIQSSQTDIDISNKTVKIEVQRSAATKDYKLHRGVAIVASQFEKIIVADAKQSKVVTPKNITNLLISVPVAPNAWFSFNISGTFDKTSQVMAFDSQSLLGRQVVIDNSTKNLVSGSTTSNKLLVWCTTSGKTLPEMTLSYSQIACNATSDHICDNNSRCIPANKMCKGRAYCDDGSDLKVACTSGPAPPPKVVYSGLSGVTVFFLSLLMLAVGSLATLYGPDLFKTLENRFRSGQYTTFSSTE